ncbi:CsgG/HfaB family protein [Algoriphagus sediminis]|uniref:CsgG/HfaB family protein n=1 Tax=Algoriphagus sediminis TaxID=3057113 RepID=A0ABT7Y886_9BACT|nr:CsgG/HfaB family protein [Algoriphagus sediminis]MDN3202734.1 CsgG/HfaB family protein [Algoriphagus sediminis]
MKNQNNSNTIISVLLMTIIIASCTPAMYQPLNERNARLGPESPMKKELLDLPDPQEPVYVAVYKFRDQTGQYKESDVGANWSTAVTQGATNILIRALEESGWFIPIERENISNLLNERKIIRSSREQYENGNGNVLLPPLLFAGVLLEGGIISYETNVFTGGAGVRYFGADASAQYREDRVSIYLRAVSTNNGKILKTIYTTKSILSQEVSAGFFRYVKFRRLLEAETGYTYNEPTEMAITEAVEKAVHSMILDGVMDELWNFEETNEETEALLADYRLEREENVKTDYIGRQFDPVGRSNVYLGVYGNGQSFVGDYSGTTIRPGFNMNLGVKISKSLLVEGGAGIQQIEIPERFQSVDYYSDLSLLYLINGNGKLSPFLSVGGGTYFDVSDNVGVSDNAWLPYIKYAAGTEYLISKNTALSFKANLNQLLNDRYDGIESGSFNDVIWGVNLGLKFYLGK